MELTDKKYLKNFKKTATTVIADHLLYDKETDIIMINRGLFSPGKQEIFYASSIRNFEVIKDGESSEKFGLGGAALGGVLFGPVGLLGGFLLKKKKNEINDLRVRINTDGESTIHDVVLLNTKTKADGVFSKLANQSMEEIVNFLQSKLFNK
ncbi:hypothetical protein [Leuconostoc mesenteroides]|uniref:hypothetical protein n=1 Tax=Leuconostoc mesenteroides TaxID=1245 RepID=UPI001FB9E907|nr:hypothetical protein [Leuconostoc mesenteroides]MCJ2160613.1 hypothetical protein [Leuconostoc mesenteroides]MCM6836118.1 hypothetical protein [Leuconostoc mesenteroides]